jgi:membrane-bound serine protease (ClpP class)
LRRLAIGLLAAAAATFVAGAVAATPAGAQDDDAGSAAAGAPVDVLQVSGLLDDIQLDSIDAAIDRADATGAQALILQMNSRGAVVGRDAMVDLLQRVADAPIPVAVWVGPSGARLYGTPAQLLAVADVTGMAPGARVGHTGIPLALPDAEVSFGEAEAALRTRSLGLSDARELGVFKQRISDEGIPTIVNMVYALDGFEGPDGALDTVTERVTDDGTVQREATTVRFSKLSLIDQIFHTVASPAVTYLLLLIGLALLIFEFFTAGVGVAGVVGAGCVVLAATGLAALPARGWAVGVLLAAMLAFAIDVQVGIPRFWTGVGIALTVIGSLFLFESLPGATLRPSWITLLAGIGGTALAFVVGMPSMVRTRFATPTIGREWMIGSLGDVVEPVDPDGVVSVADARWRARTNRATPVAAGERVRVIAIDGVTLEVEPLEGAARDHREQRSARRQHGRDAASTPPTRPAPPTGEHP